MPKVLISSMQFHKDTYPGVIKMKIYECVNLECLEEYESIPVYCHNCGCTEFNEVELN